MAVTDADDKLWVGDRLAVRSAPPRWPHILNECLSLWLWAQTLPQWLVELPLTHLDVSSCRAASVGVISKLTSLTALSLQVLTCSRTCPVSPHCTLCVAIRKL